MHSQPNYNQRATNLTQAYANATATLLHHFRQARHQAKFTEHAPHVPETPGSIEASVPTYGGEIADGVHRFHLGGVNFRNGNSESLRKLSDFSTGNCVEVPFGRT